MTKLLTVVLLLTAGNLLIASSQDADIGSKLDSLTETVNTIKDHVQYTRNEIDDVESELDDFGDEVDDLEEEVEDVGEELGDLQDKVVSKSAELQALIQSITGSLKTDYNTKIEGLRSDITALQQDMRSSIKLLHQMLANQGNEPMCNGTRGQMEGSLEQEVRLTLNLVRQVLSNQGDGVVCNSTYQQQVESSVEQNVRSTLNLVRELMARQSEGRQCNGTTGQELEPRMQSNGNLSLSLLQEIREKLDFGTDEVISVCNDTRQQEILNKLDDIEKYFHSNDTKVTRPSDQSQLLGTCDSLPASCLEILERNPSAPSGYYWIQRTSQKVYCDMTKRCCGSRGGWVRVAYIDATDPHYQCPPGLERRTSPIRTCRRTSLGCASFIIPTFNIKYSRVCGRVRGYQRGYLYAFNNYYYDSSMTIDSYYVDGISLTHGSNPRKHIWTFAVAYDGTVSNHYACPCTRTDTTYSGRVPPFIGTDYFCDSGSTTTVSKSHLYSTNPLWDGSGCGTTSSCCHFHTPPWFCNLLPLKSTEDIEVRVCARGYTSYYGYREVEFDQIELYIQ